MISLSTRTCLEHWAKKAFIFYENKQEHVVLFAAQPISQMAVASLTA
jgi:hypothetical protein